MKLNLRKIVKSFELFIIKLSYEEKKCSMVYSSQSLLLLEVSKICLVHLIFLSDLSGNFIPRTIFKMSVFCETSKSLKKYPAPLNEYIEQDE